MQKAVEKFHLVELADTPGRVIRGGCRIRYNGTQFVPAHNLCLQPGLCKGDDEKRNKFFFPLKVCGLMNARMTLCFSAMLI